MPIRGMGENGLERRWVASLRLIEGIPAERARVRTTLAYRFTDAFQLGIEVNPKDDDVGPIANWRIVDEGEKRPAIVIGTSSDRIGSTSGRAVYATASKDLEAWTGLPIAPYVGVSYGGFFNELTEVGGLYVRWHEQVSSTHLWDGYNLHHLLSYATRDGWSLGAVLVEQEGDYYAGLSLGLPFAWPWGRGEDD